MKFFKKATGDTAQHRIPKKPILHQMLKVVSIYSLYVDSINKH